MREKPSKTLARRAAGDVILRRPVMWDKPWVDSGRGLDSIQTAAVIGVTHQAVSLLTRTALHKLKNGLQKIDREEGGRLLAHPSERKRIFSAISEIYHEREQEMVQCILEDQTPEPGEEAFFAELSRIHHERTIEKQVG